VAIGAAEFRGEYRGGMPTIGCPGCNGALVPFDVRHARTILLDDTAV
jgi:hypothetical protein